MYTVCEINGNIVMSQKGEALDAMQRNATAYSGAVVRTISDEEYSAIIDAENAEYLAQAAAKRAERAAARDKLFGDGVDLIARIQSAAATPQLKQLLLDIVEIIK